MNKRRIISGVLVICLLLLSMLGSYAADPVGKDDQAIAASLNQVGLITGDGKGNFSLTSNLKRSEAAVFIVKLMGKAAVVNENKALYVNTGFNDVKPTDALAAYIGFCKENGIISGIGNNNFGPTLNVTEKAFLTMTLKVLGYTNDDFNSATVFQKAYEVGLVVDESYLLKTEDNKNFKRADVVKVMYRALGVNEKDTNTPLIKKLIMEGQVDSAKAIEAGLVYDELPTAISGISVKSSEWINLRLNEKVSPVTETDIKIYEKNKRVALNFKLVSQTDDELKIKTDPQRSSVEYIIELKNIKDKDLNVVKKVESTFVGYENKEMISDIFQISKVEQKSNNELLIYFTHPININAEQPEYYSILQSGNEVVKGNKYNMTAKVVEGKTNVVIINTKEFLFQADLEYSIKISGSLISAYGTNLGLEAGDQRDFIARNIQSEQFKLAGIIALNNKSIQLDFNKQVNKTIAEQVFSYYITEITVGTPIQIIKATTTDNIYGKDCAVILTIAGTFDGKTAYSIMINSITDVSKVEKIQEQKFSFNATILPNTDLKVTSIIPIDLNCLSISFDKNINPVEAENIANYSILCLNNTSYNVAPIKALYSSDDPKSVKLYLSYLKPMTAGYTYKVSISSNFQDYTGAKNSAPMEFSYIATNVQKVKPEVTKAAFIAKDTVKITFSKDIALDAPNILTQNYYIQIVGDDSSKKVPLSINYIDKNTIVLKFDRIDFTKQYYFKYNNIKDITAELYSGSQISTPIISGQ